MIRLQQKLDYLLHKDINELYITNALRTFAVSIVGLFVPIFLMEKGLSLTTIFLYLSFQYMLYIPICYSAMKFSARRGVKHTMLLSAPTIIIFFLILYNIDPIQKITSWVFVLFLMGIFNSLGTALYWNGYHIEFSKFSKKKNAKQVGVINIVATASAALAPLIGALIISALGFQVMFIVVMAILFLSVFPLFLSKEIHVPFEFNLKDVVTKKTGSLVLPYFSEGVKSIASSIAWPILLYIIFVSYNNIGSIYTISHVAIIIFMWLVSHKITSKNKFSFLKIGAYIHAITMIIRVFIKNFFALNIIQAIGGVSWALIHIPFSSIFYDNTKKLGISSAVYFRELHLHMGRVAGTLIFLILLFFLKPADALSGIIIVGAMFTLLMSNLKNVNKVKDI